jgi:pyruvate dehydrogenase E1 component
VFFQPHSAPGVYARAFLEGRLSEADLAHYRQEIVAPANGARGLSSYPHPWLMPDFWQFPTGSMGLGPISSIYHARFMRYLTPPRPARLQHAQGLGRVRRRRDGRAREHERTDAGRAREGLDNLVWVVNCNLQRLDGPVRGNGRIIDELERCSPAPAGTSSSWCGAATGTACSRATHSGALARAFAQTVDGQMQTFAAKDGRYNRDTSSARTPNWRAWRRA